MGQAWLAMGPIGTHSPRGFCYDMHKKDTLNIIYNRLLFFYINMCIQCAANWHVSQASDGKLMQTLKVSNF